jgi:hypothetical protein
MADDSSGFDGAKLVTGGLAIVSSTAGLVGAFTGALPRLIRNNSGYFLLAVGLALLAIALSFAASEFGTPKPPSGVSWPRLVLTSLSLVAFAAAASILVKGLTQTIGTGDQPRLSANWTFPAGQQPVLTVHMQLDDLKARQTVYLDVTSLGSKSAKTVYRSQTGADQDGIADETFDVPLPTGATGLQVVAAVDYATACNGARIPELVLPQEPHASSINKKAIAAATPTPTAPALQPPVARNKPLNFSCIQATAPVKPIASASAAKPRK